MISTQNGARRVSIRAPRCRGAMLADAEPDARCTAFQSAPLVAEGRCLAGDRELSRYASVSIRAPRCRGAMRERGGAYLQVVSVSIRAPRCRGAMLLQWGTPADMVKFQSAPLVAEGRCPGQHPQVALADQVSIRAPRCRGAMPFLPEVAMPPLAEFQSAPLVAEGRCRTGDGN